MIDRAAGPPTPRGHAARIGITVLNLIVPGLGLFRVGNFRAGVLLVSAPLALIALVTFGMGHFPIVSYRRAVLALAVVIGLVTAIYVVSAVLTWRRSKFRLPAHRWSRWYGLTAIALIALSVPQAEVPLMRRYYKPFYAPSESMTPAIGEGDQFIVDMRWRGPLRRGSIIVFQGSDGVRVSRVVATEGDRIAMRGGVPVLNRKIAVELPQGRVAVRSYDGAITAALLAERLPGERLSHEVLDTGQSPFDDTQEVTVPRHHFYVLGDNRDRSADSRVSSELGGVGMVPDTAIVGRPLYIHWSSDRAKIGARLDK